MTAHTFSKTAAGTVPSPGASASSSPITDEARPAADHPKRLTLSAILELMLTRPTQGSYVSITRAPNGGHTIDVKVSVVDAHTVDAASYLAQFITDELSAKYPPLEEHANSSISLTRNAKGETQIDITGRTSPDRTTVEELAAVVAKVYDEQRRAYPMANGLTAKPGSVA